jgi:hypothetical protein
MQDPPPPPVVSANDEGDLTEVAEASQVLTGSAVGAVIVRPTAGMVVVQTVDAALVRMQIRDLIEERTVRTPS